MQNYKLNNNNDNNNIKKIEKKFDFSAKKPKITNNHKIQANKTKSKRE